MPAIAAYAPGKIILTGEHAVVYGQPAIAAPVEEVRARAGIEANPTEPDGKINIIAPDIGLDTSLDALPLEHPIATVFREVRQELGLDHLPAMTLNITSTIPIAAGLGSGAAISVAVSRALSSFLGSPLSDEVVSRIAFETDRFYHGTPSGIDNSVISYGRMIYFTRGQPLEILTNAETLTLVIADSGEKSLTGKVVHGLRTRIELDPQRYDPILEKIGVVSFSARETIEKGDPVGLGNLLNDDHSLLQQLGVSSANLDLLVRIAREAGALGAKLSGAGCGGNMIALVEPDNAQAVAAALMSAGAVNAIFTTIPQS